MKRKLSHLATLGAMLVVGLPVCRAGDLKITLPAPSKFTPVQRLNRSGVEAIGKHDYAKAESLFLQAYLYDPADPFTLNNLGYTAELRGDQDRAQKYYALATQQGGDARIDRSNVPVLVGEPLTDALTTPKDLPMRINRMNVQAIELLSQKRNFDACDLLERALALEPMNAFTMNNLGVAEEATGDFEAALRHYDAAAGFHSSELIVVSPKRSNRGKPVSDMAALNARELRDKMINLAGNTMQANMLAVRGVTAVNANDWQTARRDFLKAYALDPENAFALNNRGYVAEKEGDLESAQFYYGKARKAADAKRRVGLATLSASEGEPLSTVAAESRQGVDGRLEAYSRERREQPGSVELIPRDNAPGADAAPVLPKTQ